MQPGTYAPPPPPGVPSEQVTPSKWWFLAAGLVAVVGIVIAVIWFVVGLMNFFEKIDDFQRVDVPGTTEFEIDDPGGYSVYHEYAGASGDDGFGGRFVSSPSVVITDPSGDEVPLRPYTSSVSYSNSGHEGIALSTFDAEQAGTYTVEVDGEAGTEVAIGPGIGSGLVATIVGGFVIGGLGVVIGGVMAIVVGVRRSRNRRSLMGPLPPPGPPGGWGGGYPGQAPQPGYGGYPAAGGPGYGGYGPPPATPGYGAPSGPGYGPPPGAAPPTPAGPGYGPPPGPGHAPPPAPGGVGAPTPQDAPPSDAPPSGQYPPPAPPQ